MTVERRLRVLLLAEQCNPRWPSLPVVGYNYALALSRRCDVVVVTQIRNEPHLRERHPVDTEALTFSFVDTEYVARPLHRLAGWLRGDPEVAWSTGMAMAYLPYLEFERQAWRRFRDVLRAHEFDLVHRITPMSPTLPSFMAGRAPVPFVIGPLNGNLDWPQEYSAEKRREKERLRRLRDAYKWLPFQRRTWRGSDRVLAAFEHTIDDLDRVPAERIVSLPEVGFDDSVFHPGDEPAAGSGDDASLTFLFVGRLVPYKLAEVAIRAFLGSPTLRAHHRLRVVGDGPERERLRALVQDEGAADRVVLEGRRDQSQVAEIMRDSDIFVFPSIRELGAGVVVEAMACGLVCLVVDYGGPGDLVDADRGRKIAMAPLEELVTAFRAEMEELAAADPAQRRALRSAAIDYAHAGFTWDRKAELTESIYRDLLSHG